MTGRFTAVRDERFPNGLSLGAIVRVRRDRIQPFADQPRRYFDPAGLKELARSIRAVGQQVPVTVRPLAGDPSHDYELIDGQRRWLACGELGREWMTAWVREDVTDVAEQFVASVVANFSREGHTHLEIARAIARIRERSDIRARPRGEQADAIAEIFGRTTAWVYMHEQLLELAPAVQALLEPPIPEARRLSMEIALLLVQCEAAAQITLARKITAGRQRMRTAQAKFLIRQHLGDGETKRSAEADQPARAFTGFRRFIHRLADDLAVIVEGSTAKLREAFLSRDQTDRQLILSTVERCLEDLGQLRQALRRLERAGGGASRPAAGRDEARRMKETA